jgi:Cys-rich protein (TIGR01571 family)
MPYLDYARRVQIGFFDFFLCGFAWRDFRFPKRFCFLQSRFKGISSDTQYFFLLSEVRTMTDNYLAAAIPRHAQISHTRDAATSVSRAASLASAAYSSTSVPNRAVCGACGRDRLTDSTKPRAASLLARPPSHVTSTPTSWSTGLFSCCGDCGVAVDVCLCGPCSMSRQRMALQGHADTCSSADYMLGKEKPHWQVCAIREGVVRKYRINENGTYCKAWCCPLCSLCQTHRELTARGMWPGGTCCVSQPDVPACYKPMS